MASGPPRRIGLTGRAAVLAASALVVTSCNLPRFGAPNAASEEGARVQDLWSIFFVLAALVTLTVWVPMAILLVRFRRRRHDETIPNQRPYNIPIEIAYTAVPILLVGVLFFISVRVELEAEAVAADPAVEVEVVGFQWGWQFRYHDEGFTVDAAPGELPELVLPVNEASNLQLVSVDVNHSFWVPDFLSKRDLIPGVDNEITLTPDRPGTYDGRCAEFCGLDHWRMGFTVRVVPMDQYRSWADEQAASAAAEPAVPSTTTTPGGGG